ncbi:hypothetical protein FJZ39_03425 [Candidatus Saccharibacteria bacterium]|nr:hypothetical protein [Candidatus Saccharibacteria bacterium]
MKKSSPSVSISSQQISRNLRHFIGRFHIVLFTVLVLGGLAFTVFTLYRIYASAINVQPTQSTAVNYDITTIEQIESLRTRNDSSAVTPLPNDRRTNPFTE